MLSRNQKILCTGLFFIFISVGATVGPEAMGYLWRADVNARIGSYQFDIPENETIPRASNPILRKMTGLGGKDESLVFLIPAAEVGVQVPAYKSQEEGRSLDVKGIIRVWDTLRIEQYLKPDRYRDLWYGQGRYKNRIVELQEGAPLYRVFRDSSHRNAWVVLNQMPLAGVPQPEVMDEYWVARCSKQGRGGVFGSSFVMCNSYFFVDDIVVEFYLSEDNLAHVGDIRNIIREKIMVWKKTV